MEALIASAAAATAFIAVLALRRKDPIVEGRIAKLRDLTGPSERPGKRIRIIEALGERHPAEHPPVIRRLAAAGLDWTAERFLGAKIALGALGFFSGALMGSSALVAMLVLGAVAYLLPDFYLAARAKDRKGELEAVLPDAVDLLAVATKGGLNLQLALQRVAAAMQGPLGDELRRADREISLGATRSAALDAMAGRLEIEDVSALASTLSGSDRFGVPVADALESFSDELRGRRRRAAEEQARKAPVKMLFPLIICILPAFVLLTIVPLLLGTFRSLGF